MEKESCFQILKEKQEEKEKKEVLVLGVGFEEQKIRLN